MNTKRAQTTKPSKADTRVFVGGPNIFQSLGRPDADAAFAKVELAYSIHAIIERRGLNQTQAAALLRTDRARVSNLMRGRLKEFSIERLFHFLIALGQDVDVTVRPKRRANAQVHVLAKAG